MTWARFEDLGQKNLDFGFREQKVAFVWEVETRITRESSVGSEQDDERYDVNYRVEKISYFQK